MKRFFHSWTDDFFLLHIQLNNGKGLEGEVVVMRQYEDGTVRNESVFMKKDMNSHRFMISRTHPGETSFSIEYPEDIILEAFKVDDRAYYPTQSFYKE
jgi:hypothetical protein